MTEQRPTTAPTAFYIPNGNGFLSTTATTSPWDGSQQHGGPPSALLARAIETYDARSDMAISRISINFLGPLQHGRMTLTTEVLRLGHRIDVIEARLNANGRPVATARGLRQPLAPDTALARTSNWPAVATHPAKEPHDFDRVDSDWGYDRAVEWSFVPGSYQDSAPAAAWARPRIPLVEGEQPTGLQRTLIVADSANGLSAELDLGDRIFLPPTLTFTLYREPSDDWLFMDAATRADPRGVGIAHTTLADRYGQFGVATQPHLVQQRSA